MQGIQNSVQANAAKRTPEQLGRALAAAQGEVEALRQRLGRLEGGGRGIGGGSAAGGEVEAACTPAGRARRSGAGKWALVCALQLTGLLAYFAAAERLGCA